MSASIRVGQQSWATGGSKKTDLRRIKQAAKSASGRPPAAAVTLLPLSCSLQLSPLRVQAALLHQAARGRRERRVPPRRASEPARLSRGRPAPSWHGARDSRAISSGSRDLAPTCFAGPQRRPPPVGRGLTAAARLPLSPPSLASVAGGDGLASARQASCCCAAPRPRHTRPPFTRALLSAARPDGTHRAARVAGGVTASTAGVGHSKVSPSGYHRGTIGVPSCSYSADTARALGYRACLRLDHAHAQVIVLPEDAILLVACGAKVCGGRLGQRGSREATPVPSALSGALARGSVARRRLEPQGGQLCCC